MSSRDSKFNSLKLELARAAYGRLTEGVSPEVEVQQIINALGERGENLKDKVAVDLLTSNFGAFRYAKGMISLAEGYELDDLKEEIRILENKALGNEARNKGKER